MKSQKQRFLAWLDRTTIGKEVVSFDELLLEGACTVLGIDGMAAERFVQANATRYWNYVLEKLDKDRRKAVSVLFEVGDQAMRRMRWLPLWSVTHGCGKERRRGVLLGSRSRFLETFDDLSDREYEALACVVCHVVGSRRTHLTPVGDEGGIDFFSIFELPGKCHLFSGPAGPLRIVGQVKHYSNRLDKGRVNEFITAVENVRRRSPEVEDHVPSWFRASSGPIAGWLVAHSGLQEGARQVARDHGIITGTSLDLAEIVCLSRSIGEGLPVDGRVEFLREKISQLLD